MFRRYDAGRSDSAFRSFTDGLPIDACRQRQPFEDLPVDRGLWVFLIFAVMSWVTVWAVLMHPRGLREEPNPLAASELVAASPASASLLSIPAASASEDAILTTRGILPATDELRREIQSIGRHLGDEKAAPRLISIFPGRTSRSAASGLSDVTTIGKDAAKRTSGAGEAAEIGGSGWADRTRTQDERSGVRDVPVEMPSTTPPVVHRVQDGDTLPDLAARYLGDASLWPILFELNRDRISSPDLLPLGAPLIMEPARAAGAEQAGTLYPQAVPGLKDDLPPLESVDTTRFVDPADSRKMP